jgi:hypothetical protein
MAQSAHGVIAYWTTVTGSDSSSNPIEEIVGWNGPNISAPVIDITHLSDTAKNKLLGLYDSGQVSFDVNFMATNIGSTSNTLGKMRESLTNRTRGVLSIQFSTVSTTKKVVCDAFVSGISITGAVDQKIACSITLDLTGGPTWTT